MIRPDKVEQIQLLRAQHPRWGNRRIAQELGLARNTVRDYLRGKEALVQSRPARRALDEATVALAVALLDGAAEGNGVVVRRLLAARGIDVALRTLERALQPYRQRARAAKSATVRFETLPGEQLQIDFGQRMVSIGGAPTRVFFFVAVLGFSRRIFVRASLSSRQEEWRAGLAGAFAHFGGLPRAVLIDNDGALVVGRDRETDTARIHPGFAAFCKDWGVAVRVCHPYRPRTKGKTESGVKYVKRNGIAGQDFASFAALTAWLPQWMALADGRIHGTTHERPHERFERAEKAALQPLPSIPPAHEPRVLKRTVAGDCCVDVETIRYTVPHRLVREHVEVVVGLEHIRVLHRGVEVARHRRSFTRHQIVRDPEHLRGLLRVDPPQPRPSGPGPLQTLGRSLDAYADAIGGAP
ncbi:MAG: IS21 family transposase [Actinobacteria bacterium]|nr:IS21 family transposase [Actinomycetota bacterium]